MRAKKRLYLTHQTFRNSDLCRRVLAKPAIPIAYGWKLTSKLVDPYIKETM